MAHRARESREARVAIAGDELGTYDDRGARRGAQPFEPSLRERHRGHAVERVARHLPSVLAPLDARRVREEIPPVGEQVDAVAQLAAPHPLDVAREVVLPAACGELHGSVGLRAPLVGPRAPRVVAAVARVDVEHDEPASRARSDGDVEIVAALEPAANLRLVRRGIVNAVRAGWQLGIWQDREHRPAPGGVCERCFEQGHGDTCAACQRARAWCCSA